jgi:hypothetical protein
MCQKARARPIKLLKRGRVPRMSYIDHKRFQSNIARAADARKVRLLRNGKATARKVRLLRNGESTNTMNEEGKKKANHI